MGNRRRVPLEGRSIKQGTGGWRYQVHRTCQPRGQVKCTAGSGQVREVRSHGLPSKQINIKCPHLDTICSICQANRIAHPAKWAGSAVCIAASSRAHKVSLPWVGCGIIETIAQKIPLIGRPIKNSALHQESAVSDYMSGFFLRIYLLPASAAMHPSSDRNTCPTTRTDAGAARPHAGSHAAT